jgi:hypothetical protein
VRACVWRSFVRACTRVFAAMKGWLCVGGCAGSEGRAALTLIR